MIEGKEAITAKGWPQHNLPISHAVKANGMIYCSGAVPVDPTDLSIIAGDIEIQTDRALKNVKSLLEAGGSSLGHVVKVTVFLRDKKDFEGMNKVFGRYFSENQPARITVQADFMIDVGIEIDVIALAG